MERVVGDFNRPNLRLQVIQANRLAEKNEQLMRLIAGEEHPPSSTPAHVRKRSEPSICSPVEALACASTTAGSGPKSEPERNGTSKTTVCRLWWRPWPSAWALISQISGVSFITTFQARWKATIRKRGAPGATASPRPVHSCTPKATYAFSAFSSIRLTPPPSWWFDYTCAAGSPPLGGIGRRPGHG